MKVTGVIPARFQSTRFPGKPLVPLLGKPLLQWVIEASQKSRSLDQIIVATDHVEIFNLAKRCGVQAVMTPSDVPTGSDRVWLAIRDFETDVVVNIQGDEPLIQGSLLDQMVGPFAEKPEIHMVTLGRPFKAGEVEAMQTAKIVLNDRDEALYFSRYPIPYSREDYKSQQEWPAALKHIGMYAYRKSFLEKFCQRGPVAIEQCEGLEQLRALYLGARIYVLKVESESWGVDYPEDVMRVEKLLKKTGVN